MADDLWVRNRLADAKSGDDRLATGPGDDHGDDQTTTSTISVGGPPATGVIGVAGDADWFRFQAVAGEGVRFEVQGATFATVILRIHDQWGNFVATYTGPAADAAVAGALSAGDYYVSIHGFDSQGAFTTGSYSIVATTVADDHGDTFDTATQVTVDGAAITMSDEGIADRDMVRFEANGGVPLVFNFDDMPVNGVGYTIYDRYGRALHSNIILNESMYVPFVPEEDGVYYISFAGATGVTFNITTAVDDFVETLPANGHITIDGPAVNGRYDFYGDMDVFSVTLGAPGTYRFEMSPLTFNLVSMMAIYDKDGFLIDYNVLYMPGQGMTFVVDTAGTYHIALTQLDSVVNHDQRYTLTATSVADDFRGGVGSTGVAIINGATLNGAVQFNEDADWIAVTLNYGDTIRFHIESPDFAHTTHMYDSTGLSIVPPMSFYSSEADRYFTAYATGTYYISVMGWDPTDQGAYTMSVTSVADDFTPANRGVISAGGTAAGVLEYNNDGDIFAINVTAGQTVEFFADTAFRYDLNIRGAADNDMLAYSNSLVINRPLTYTFGAAGTYYVSISGGYAGVGGGVGGYTLHANTLTDDFTSNTTRTGEIVVNGPSTSGAVNYGNDSDWFAVTVSAGQAVHFSIDHPGMLDVRLELVGLSTMAPFNRVGHGFTYYFEQGGTYYVQAYGTYFEETGGYTITATTLADDFAATVATTGALAVGGSASGVINYNYDSDWFEISLAAGVEYTFSLTGLSGGGHLSVYDENGVVISSINDTYVVSTDFTALYDGVHYIRVTNGSSGDYTLSATLGPPPSLLQSIDPNVPSILPGDAFQHTHYGPANVVQVYFAGMGEAFGGSTSTGWTAQDTAAVMAILAQFEAYLNIDFQITTTLPHADLVLTTFSDPNYVTRFDRADWDMPIPVVGFSTAVSTWSAAALAEGGLGAAAVLNAIGYAMGLAFPHLAESGSVLMEGVDDETDLGDFNLNQGVHTIMSFNDGWATSGYGVSGSSDYGWQFGPMALDIAVLQAIYGANTTYNNGANTYTLRDTNAAGTGWRAIWDTGGADTIVYAGTRNATIDLRAATLQYENGGGGFVSSAFGVHGGFTIANGVVIENATGGAGDDVITGNAVANTLLGNGGADTIDGGGGADIILAHAGADTLLGGEGNDWLDGGAGADIINGGAGNDTAAYGASAAAVNIDLQSGVYSGGDAVGDVLTSIEGISGSSHADNIFGNANANSLFGQGGADFIQGRGGADAIYGGDGNDWLDGGAGADTIDGGAGTDTAAYGASIAAVSIDLQSGAYSGGDAAGDVLLNIEGVSGSGHADNIFGNANANSLFGQGGADFIQGRGGGDTISGGDGNDWLDGGTGADAIDGGAGNDTAAYGSSIAAVSIDLQSGVYSGGDAAGDVLTNIEGVSGSSHADNIFGNANANSLFGQGGNDFIQGRGGGDFIYGGDGNDWLDGGLGADTIDGGAGADTAAYGSSASAVSIDLQSGVYSGGDAAGDVLIGIEGLSGSSHNDTLSGNASANTLFGQGGADTLNGRGGNDTLNGGAGNDRFVFAPGAGDDVISDFVAGGAEDWIDLSGYQGSGVTWTITQVGANTVFDFTNGDSITLLNVNASALTQIDPWSWG